jgi:hypothetical protein
LNQFSAPSGTDADSAARVHHPVPGHYRSIRQGMQRITHLASMTTDAGQ